MTTRPIAEILHESEQQIVDRIHGRDYTRAELRAAFDRVADPKDWKAPIDCTLRIQFPSTIEVIHRAVVFFAGCEATITPTKRVGYFRVQAAGYRAAVGA